jgi:chromosome segregation ATPase
MPEMKLNQMDAAQLNAHLSSLQAKLNEYSNIYQQGLSDLTGIQNKRIEAQKDENALKNNLKALRERMGATKEEIKSVKILLRAEAAGL